MSKPITHHVPLGSSMRLLGNVTTKKKPWTRRDILRTKRTKEKLSNLIASFREAQEQPRETLGRRVGLTKRLKGGYKIVGITNLIETKDFALVKKTAYAEGFTHLKLGGRIISLQPK